MKNLLSEIEIKTLNKFGQFEMTASHTYMHLANSMKTISAFGAEKFFNAESDDERVHYRAIEEFMNDMGAQLSVESLESENTAIPDIKSALETAYQMELELMEAYEKSAINPELSFKVKLKLYEFVEIQTKAVGEYGDLLARIALTNDMLLFDKELGN